MNTFTPYWLAIFGAFFVVEFTALFTQKKGKGGPAGGTLSALIWRFIAWKGNHKFARAAFFVFWVDLTAHFFFQTPLFPGL